MWNEMDTDPFIKGKRGESQAFGVDVVLSDEAFMFENQQLTVPTPVCDPLKALGKTSLTSDALSTKNERANLHQLPSRR
jgi:hypothetical protein